MKRNKPTCTKLSPGIYSDGTLRPLDLCAAFAPHVAALRLSRAERKEVTALMRLLENEMGKPYVERDGYAPVFADAWDALSETIERHTPRGAYFGSSEGDGACIGIWPEASNE